MEGNNFYCLYPNNLSRKCHFLYLFFGRNNNVILNGNGLWNDNGNMASTTLNSGLDFTYNWNSKLHKVRQGNAIIMSVKYDPDGNRIFKDSSESGQRKYIVDIVGDLPVILMELNNSGGIVKTYIYANSQIIAQHTGDHEADRYFYLHDRLGSVRKIIDTAGNVKNRYTYDPFGELYPAPDFEEMVDNPFKFTGQYFDSEIDQYYLRARQYDPHIARFTARDPIEGDFKEPLTLHMYLYCINDPINKADPLGEEWNLPELTVTTKTYLCLTAEELAKIGIGMGIFTLVTQQIYQYNVAIGLGTRSDSWLSTILAWFAARGNSPKFRGGRITQRDKWYGLEKQPDFNNFKRWWEKYAKKFFKGGGKDASREQVLDAYEEFVQKWANKKW